MLRRVHYYCYLPLLGLCLASCSALVLNEKKPENIDFSGYWELNSDLSSGPRGASRSRSAGMESDVLRTEGLKREVLSDPFVFVSHDFHIVDARLLIIELDTRSIGLRYQPGTYRDVTFGKRTRGLWDIYAGWEDLELVILSRANDLKVIETISLVGPKRLRVIVNIEAEKKNWHFIKVFDQK